MSHAYHGSAGLTVGEIGSSTNSESPAYHTRVPLHPFNPQFYRKPHRQTARLQERPVKVWYHERNHDVHHQPLNNHYWITMRYRHNVLLESRQDVGGRYPSLSRLPGLDPYGPSDAY